MKKLKLIAFLGLIFSLIFVSCNYILPEPENYKKIKDEYNLSKIMSPIKRNATSTEIVAAELEARWDRMSEILEIMQNSSISAEKKAKLQEEAIDIAKDVEI
jgi:hypothetical protein